MIRVQFWGPQSDAEIGTRTRKARGLGATRFQPFGFAPKSVPKKLADSKPQASSCKPNLSYLEERLAHHKGTRTRRSLVFPSCLLHSVEGLAPRATNCRGHTKRSHSESIYGFSFWEPKCPADRTNTTTKNANGLPIQPSHAHNWRMSGHSV